MESHNTFTIRVIQGTWWEALTPDPQLCSIGVQTLCQTPFSECTLLSDFFQMFKIRSAKTEVIWFLTNKKILLWNLKCIAHRMVSCVSHTHTHTHSHLDKHYSPPSERSMKIIGVYHSQRIVIQDYEMLSR